MSEFTSHAVTKSLRFSIHVLPNGSYEIVDEITHTSYIGQATPTEVVQVLHALNCGDLAVEELPEFKL